MEKLEGIHPINMLAAILTLPSMVETDEEQKSVADVVSRSIASLYLNKRASVVFLSEVFKTIITRPENKFAMDVMQRAIDSVPDFHLIQDMNPID